MNASKMLRVGIAVVAVSLAVGAGTARAGSPPPPVAGCGNGLSPTYSPALEALVSSSTQGNVNGDGWVCVNSAGYENSNGHFDKIVIVDNTVPL
jgi:hypothetical protein